MQILPNTIQAIEKKTTEAVKVQSGNMQSFNDIFNSKLQDAMPVQFSKHATARLQTRDITLSTEQMKRVEDGVNQARQKGIKDSLVFVDTVALLVNVPSKTVITAMNTDTKQKGTNFFTNIDGAVIV